MNFQNYPPGGSAPSNFRRQASRNIAEAGQLTTFFHTKISVYDGVIHGPATFRILRLQNVLHNMSMLNSGRADIQSGMGAGSMEVAFHQKRPLLFSKMRNKLRPGLQKPDCLNGTSVLP